LLTKVRVIFGRAGKGGALAPPWKAAYHWGALAPEATWLQGLKAQLIVVPEAAGLKPRPSKVRIAAQSVIMYESDLGN